MTPPIYRARCKDNGEWVEGYYWLYQLIDSDFHYIMAIGITDEYGDVNFSIDPSTLTISFDGGNKWCNIKEVAYLTREYIPIEDKQ